MYEIRIPNLDEAAVTRLLDLLQEHVREAQVYRNGKPLAWGLVPNEEDPRG